MSPRAHQVLAIALVVAAVAYSAIAGGVELAAWLRRRKRHASPAGGRAAGMPLELEELEEEGML